MMKYKLLRLKVYTSEDESPSTDHDMATSGMPTHRGQMVVASRKQTPFPHGPTVDGL